MLQDLLVFNDWTILVMRLAVGVIFMAHGWKKLSDLKDTYAWFTKNGFKPGWLWGIVAAFSQFVGGIFILTGFLMQIVAVFLAIEMLIATVFNLKRKKPFFEVLELDILLLAGLLLLATLGNGFLSLNSFFGIVIF